MPQSLSFSTDEQLHIRTWDAVIAEFTQKSPESVINRKYFEVLPRIFMDDEDALLLSLRTGRKLTLDNYIFPCFYGHLIADIMVNPVSSRSVEISVFSHADSACPKTVSLRESKRFIDIGKTASGLAHGVRNPLNAIKGAVVYLREKYAQEPVLIEFTKIMEEEICRLDNFISKFLSCSLENAETATVSVNELLKKINALTALQAYAHNIRIVCEYGKIPEISASSFHIEQAVLNVMNNAIEAMQKGGTLTIRTSVESNGSNDAIMIRISDTGTGIPAASKLTVEPERRGRGFGLFIAREMLQYYGGHLEIQSERDRGTDVRLFLPLRRDRK